MENNVNVDTNTDTSEDFFTSDEETNSTDTQDNEEVAETAEETKEDTQVDKGLEVKPRIVKFLEKNVEILPEQEDALLQKGLNHDHVVEKNKKLETRIAELEKAQSEAQKVEQVEALKALGYDEDSANEIVRVRFENEELKKFKTDTLAKEQANKGEQQQKTIRETNLNAFVENFPKLDFKDLPEAVKQAYYDGESLLNAYMAEENKTIKAENEALKNNSKNKEKAIGSIETQAKIKEDKIYAGWE